MLAELPPCKVLDASACEVGRGDWSYSCSNTDSDKHNNTCRAPAHVSSSSRKHPWLLLGRTSRSTATTRAATTAGTAPRLPPVADHQPCAVLPCSGAARERAAVHGAAKGSEANNAEHILLTAAGLPVKLRQLRQGPAVASAGVCGGAASQPAV